MLKKFLLIFSLIFVNFAYGKQYTLVFANVKNKTNAKHFINRHLKNKMDVRIIKHEDRYRVIYGTFQSKREALNFVKTLPHKLKDIRPFATPLKPSKKTSYKRKKVEGTKKKVYKVHKAKKPKRQEEVLQSFMFNSTPKINKKEKRQDEYSYIEQEEIKKPTIRRVKSSNIYKNTEIKKNKKRFIFPKKYLRDSHLKTNDIIFE